MLKFFKVDGTGIRRVIEVSDKGEKLKVYCIIGRVDELLEKDIIFADNTKGNEDKWLVIENQGDVITEKTSLEEAKDYCRKKYSA
ncbi:MAG: hypothetical protein PUG48_04185 [Clostridia bacterium]|nr:hypothetical protein [Clostridia bacterium]